MIARMEFCISQMQSVTNIQQCQSTESHSTEHNNIMNLMHSMRPDQPNASV